MNDQNTPDTSAGDELQDFDVLDWITSGTVARRTITIYNDPALADEMERLETEYGKALLEEDTTAGERTISERPASEVILEQMQAVYDRWQASKAEWTVEALSSDAINEVTDLVPNAPRPVEPVAPNPPKDESRSGNPEKRALYKQAMEHYQADLAAFEVAHQEWSEGPYQEWLREQSEVSDERNLHLIAAAVISVVTPKGTASEVSVDALRAWKTRPHGKSHLSRLITAVNEITLNEVQVPSPKSLRGSVNSPD